MLDLIQHYFETPTIEQMLDETGPCPVEALLIGMCEDGKPTLINMRQNQLFFVTAPAGWGKTHFLKVMLRSFFRMGTNTPRGMSSVILTSATEEWSDTTDLVNVYELNDYNLMSVTEAAKTWSRRVGYHDQQEDYTLVMIDGNHDQLRSMHYCLSVMKNLPRFLTFVTFRSDPEIESVEYIRYGSRPGRFMAMDASGELVEFFTPRLEGGMHGYPTTTV